MKKLSLLITFVISVTCCTEKKPEQEAHDHTKLDHAMNEDEIHLSNQQIQLGNITTGSVQEQRLGEELLITGAVTVNENKAFSIASRVMGRIDKLYYKNAGENISKGAPLYEIYSEDLNIAIRELLLANEKNKTLKSEQVSLEKILQSARAKLKLYGLTDNQIKEFEDSGSAPNTVKIYSPENGVITSVDVKEGDYIMEGKPVLHLADLSTLWIEGQVYSDYLNYVKNGMNAKVTFPGLPEEEFASKIDFINPELNNSSKINLVRIEVPNMHQKLKPGLQASITILTNEVTALAVPTNAVILDGHGATVWVKTGENMFKSKMVMTGLEANGFTEITMGLEKDEEVVITGAYLLNSEFIFKKGVNPMEGHNMSKM